MGLNTSWVIFLLGVINPAPVALAQEPFNVPIKSESCNMIHVSCGGGQPATSGQAEPRNPGPPGKMGPVGPIGPQGIKGDSGDQGLKGESGRDADTKEISDGVLKMISATSCRELNTKYGVNKTGYYLIRTNGSDASRYRHCHFGHYEDVFTCHELQQSNGISESGHYILGARNKPYEVYCEFNTGSASTQVWHDTMEEIKISVVCEDHGCYSRIPVYEVDEDNMIKIIVKSEHCRQFIKFRCQGAVLLTNNNNPYGWWVSRQGEKMLYWGSSSRKPGYCGCGVTGKCVDSTKKCNCDNNLGTIITQDEGFLTDKARLPVREMRFGDMGGVGEIGWHELGYLECTGQG